MFKDTGCAGIAIGRGGLMHPWIFKRLSLWDETGDPGPHPTYRERLEFMDSHFQSMLSLRTERSACINFRKVATWYCKVLRPGKKIQQELVMIQSAEHFANMVGRIAEILSQREEKGEWHPAEHEIRLPEGPIAHW
jgi:tRNA-dihydrouridine synthase